jgi:hypothetical protein
VSFLQNEPQRRKGRKDNHSEKHISPDGKKLMHYCHSIPAGFFYLISSLRPLRLCGDILFRVVLCVLCVSAVNTKLADI